MILALFPHPPSQQMLDWVKDAAKGKQVVVHVYRFHVAEIKDIEKGLTGVLLHLADEVAAHGFTVDKFGRVLVVPPAMSLAVMGFMEGVRGLFGRYPEIIRTMIDPHGSGEYVPCPEAPTVNYTYLFERMRKARSQAAPQSSLKVL